jgi:FkbM family methyltransferase
MKQFGVRRMLRDLGSQTADRWMMRSDGTVFASRKSWFEKGRRRGMVVEWDANAELFRVTDPTGSVYVARKQRVKLQNIGVAARRARLIKAYLGSVDIVRPGDVVIDCGANIGEFSIACAQFGATVHSFEPDPREFKALCANAFDGITPVAKALWHKTERLKFYENNDSGDSGLIDIGRAASVLEIQAVRLDEYAAQAGIGERVRLIKVEAEGAEPEVLDGAGDILSKTDYVTVDMGPERGVSQESTVVDVTARLYNRGFRLIHFDCERICGLFSAVI